MEFNLQILKHLVRRKQIQLSEFTGYSDGTVRMFDLNKMDMVLKMHPHALQVTSIIFSSDGKYK